MASDPSNPAHVLVVLAETTVSAELVDAVAGRAREGPCWFRLVVPAARESRRVLEEGRPRLEEAAHRPVDGEVSSYHDPMDAIEDALAGDEFDEIILSTRMHRLTRSLHVDLPRRVAHLGLPVRTVLVGCNDETTT